VKPVSKNQIAGLFNKPGITNPRIEVIKSGTLISQLPIGLNIRSSRVSRRARL